MLRDLPMWARCGIDRPFCDKVVEEGLRHSSPSNPYRLVVEPFEYRDVGFAKGDLIVFDYPTTKPANIRLNGKLKFHGHLESVGAKKAVRLDAPPIEPRSIPGPDPTDARAAHTPPGADSAK